MTKPWTYSRGPICSTEPDIIKATTINDLLREPVGILPVRVGDPIKPFECGLWNHLRLRLRPGVSVTSLRKATGAYLHSKRYFFAMAQPDSLRFDIDGAPAAPVSNEDRLAAQERYEMLRRTDAPALEPAAPLLAKADRIRAGLLPRAQVGVASRIR
ncbi:MULTISPECIES: ProQ/FINO family protein [unclassified Rhizobium]|uniref:ProQ/FINO family protein n=1 Tax=unclassified Rhizobium TaxID=2613769 RepID=UPI0016088C91|nr:MULTISPECIES: ProQ/FINO family protein [unclassified Rhizobium]MBB3543318.1 hypothetical protein [Rhizobium sp. BK399]MCS3741670.1 hypothetical protein [Rhizobium sp. BK661]MCS4093607.1 hypothetical protein [Rhizobium sp. BK176]